MPPQLYPISTISRRSSYLMTASISGPPPAMDDQVDYALFVQSREHFIAFPLFADPFLHRPIWQPTAPVRYLASSKIIAAAFSPIMILGALVFPATTCGMIEAS